MVRSLQGIRFFDRDWSRPHPSAKCRLHPLKVGIALYLDDEIDRLSSAVARIGDRLESFFANRRYGDDVQSLVIGLILTGHGSERLHPIRPLKYRRHYTLKIRELKQETYLGNVVEFDIKPDYSAVQSLNNEDAERYISKALIDGLSVLVAHHNKFPNFKVEDFGKDFSACLNASDGASH